MIWPALRVLSSPITIEHGWASANRLGKRSSAEATTLHMLLDQYARDVAPSKRGVEVEKLRIKTLQRDPMSRYKLAALTSPSWRNGAIRVSRLVPRDRRSTAN